MRCGFFSFPVHNIISSSFHTSKFLARIRDPDCVHARARASATTSPLVCADELAPLLARASSRTAWRLKAALDPDFPAWQLAARACAVVVAAAVRADKVWRDLLRHHTAHQVCSSLAAPHKAAVPQAGAEMPAALSSAEMPLRLSHQAVGARALSPSLRQLPSASSRHRRKR